MISTIAIIVLLATIAPVFTLGVLVAFGLYMEDHFEQGVGR